VCARICKHGGHSYSRVSANEPTGFESVLKYVATFGKTQKRNDESSSSALHVLGPVVTAFEGPYHRSSSFGLVTENLK